jgi:hypothetical protein
LTAPSANLFHTQLSTAPSRYRLAMPFLVSDNRTEKPESDTLLTIGRDSGIVE